MNGFEKCFQQSVITDEIAQAYIPEQKFCELFGIYDALVKGTAFPVLVK